jgi:putative adhesin
MRREMVARLAVGTALALAAAVGAGAEDFNWTGRLGAGQTLEVKGVNGPIRALAAGGAEARVTAVKTARRSDPASVEIKVLEHGGGVTICAVYPSTSGRKPNECGAGSEGRMNSHDNDVKVEFTVHVPAGVRFVGRSVNGAVEVRDVAADAEAYSVNGAVEVSAAGNVRAETVNGSVRARAGKADWNGTASFETVNGSITVELPEDTDADLDAKTVNGGIQSDFELTGETRRDRRSLSGTIGNGGRALQLRTVNGSIQIRRSS